MRGSAAFRTGVAPGGALAGPWVKNELYRKARAVPSLDLRFADNKLLTDAITGANLVTFNRASSGTFVGSDGVLRSAVTNLVLRSEEFDNAGWTKVRATVSANTIAAPNGTLSADTGIEDASASTTHNPLIQDATIIANGTYTASLHVKTKERSRGEIWFSSIDSANYVVGSFNLGTGTISASNVGTGSGAVASIANVGDGWYRVSVTGSIGSSLTTGRLVLRLADSTGSIVYTGNGTSGIYLWGAQLEQASTVGEYIPTTSAINSAPRFDHNPTTGESLGLLVEEARTNLLLRSEEFGASWIPSNITVSPDAIVAPNGTLTADKAIATTTNGAHQLFQITSGTSGVAYTTSFYVKAGEYNRFNFGPGNTAVGGDKIATINLSLSNPVVSQDAIFNSSAFATPVGNGWYRVGATFTATATGTMTVAVLQTIIDNAGSSSFAGDGTSGLFLWGAQLEVGAFPTSYIKNIDTVLGVTRAADVASITGTNFSSFYNQTEGTVFAQTQVAGYSSTTNPDLVALLGANSVNDRIAMFLAGAGPNYRATISTNGVNQFLQNVVSLANIYDANNFAIAYKENDSVSFGRNANTTDTLVTLPVITSLNFSASGSVTKYIRRLTFWPTRLPNSTLQAISQP